MDTISFEPPEYAECSCCGARIVRLTRFVERDGAAFAVYFAKFSEGPNHDEVILIASFGDWSEDSPPSGRTAICFKLWSDADNNNTTVLGKTDDPWNAGILGEVLEREEALKSPWIQELYDLSDHIVRCDTPIKDFLARTAPSEPESVERKDT